LYGAHEYELIITNLPWSQNKAFIYKAMELGKPFIFLVKLEGLGTVYMRNFVLNSKYSFFVIPILGKNAFVNPKTQKSLQVGNVCWLIGFPKPATMMKCPEVALKYSAIPAMEEPVSEDQEIAETICEEVSILDGVGYCTNMLQVCGIDPTAWFNEILNEKSQFFQPRDVDYMKYRGNALKRTKAFVYDGDRDHIPVYVYPVSLIFVNNIYIYFFSQSVCFRRDSFMKVFSITPLWRNMVEC
jgi:hypothetical protein